MCHVAAVNPDAKFCSLFWWWFLFRACRWARDEIRICSGPTRCVYLKQPVEMIQVVGQVLCSLVTKVTRLKLRLQVNVKVWNCFGIVKKWRHICIRKSWFWGLKISQCTMCIVASMAKPGFADGPQWRVGSTGRLDQLRSSISALA